MNRSPEEYFQEQSFSTEPVAETSRFTEAERAFMEKYMGLDAGATLAAIGIEPPVAAGQAAVRASAAQASPAPPARDVPRPVPAEPLAASSTPVRDPSRPAPVPAVAAPEETLDEILRREPELLMVGFFLGEQEFVVPTLAVQEVIKYAPPARLPKAPTYVAGVINLRGKVTPLIHLKQMLEVAGGQNPDQFIIVCRRQGLQFGLIIDKVHTMYRVTQDTIEWGVESHLGANVDLICGLLKLREDLIGIVSVDRIVESIITR